MIYLNNNSIISVTKIRPVADLVYDYEFNKRDTKIDPKIDIKIINKLFIDYCIKLPVSRKNMYTVPLKPTIINIYKNRNEY